MRSWFMRSWKLEALKERDLCVLLVFRVVFREGTRSTHLPVVVVITYIRAADS